MTDALNSISLQYLLNKNITVETATEAQISDAIAYGDCYNWYIEKQKVLPSNAEIASGIFIQKYALRDSNGICVEKTPEDMWLRLAKTLASVEMKTNNKNTKTEQEWCDIFYNTFVDFKYVLGGSGLSAVGNTASKMSASNCYVIRPPKDNMNDIFRACSDMANIQKFRGGTGLDISNLRPYGAEVSNAAKESSGAVSFMDLFSKVTATVGQRGRCLEENQLVLTLRGLLPIKEVISGDLIWTSRGWIENLNTINNGIKPTYKITTKRGLEITATNNHLFTTINGEKELKDFLIGDDITTLPGTFIDIPYVSLDTDIQYDKGHGALNGGNRLNEDIILPTILNEELAYFLGYSYGDGHIEYDTFDEPRSIDLACAEAYPNIDSKLTNIINTQFTGYLPKHNKGDGKVIRLRIFSKLICLFLQKNKLLKQLHHSLILPEKILKSKTTVQMAFISGYFDADGYASGSKKGYVISSICKNMINQLQSLLMSVGIISHIFIEKRKKKTHQDLYTLSITGTLAQKKAISLLSESLKITNKLFVSKKDTVLTPFKARDLGTSHNIHSFIPDNSQFISCNIYNKLLEKKEVSDGLLVKDSIKSIEYIGETSVYDLELKEHHLFYCQGFNVHNSGATMISMRSSHPDVERFIEEKQDLDKQDFFEELKQVGINIENWKYTSIAARLKSTTKANVSLRVDDAFMEAVVSDGDYNLWFNYPIGSKYSNINKTVKAKTIWHKLVAANVKAAEPGLLFWDTIIRQSIPDCYGAGSALVNGVMTDYDFTTLGVNPCAELSLNNDACSIGSLFLYKFVKNPFSASASFDFKSFEKTIKLAIRIQDNVREYDMDFLPLPEYMTSAVLGRRIGVGFHGLADTLAALGFKYDTDEAVHMAENISNFLKNKLYEESINLGQEKGTFPIWDWEKEKNNPYIQSLDECLIAKLKQFGRRNIACQTIAPTGSISIISRNCSSGIEPVYELSYNRAVKKQSSEETVLHTIHHQALQDCIEANGDTSIFVESNSIDWKMRIKMQAACQRNIDHSISSTVNLPKDTTEDIVSDIYVEAWKNGLKGITVYVDGSRTGVLTSIEEPQQTKIHKIIERPKTTNIDIFKTKYKEKNYMILVGRADNGPIEVFGGEETGLSLPTKYKSATLTKKSRGHYSLTIQLSDDVEDILKVNNIGNLFPAQDIITLARMISLSLRNRISISDIVEQLQKSATSLYDAPAVFARVLKNYISEEELVAKEKSKGKTCPDCGESLIYKRESGCLVELCSNCSYTNSKCS